LSAELLAELAKQWDTPSPVRRALAHKRLVENVMIGEPSREDDEYFAPLVLDERCETLADHLTGQHIPSVALIEAARQTWTAVTEKYFHLGTATRFVVEALSSRFLRFVFPLPATLGYRVLGHERDHIQQRFHGTVVIRQAGAVAADFNVRFRVITEKFGTKYEAMAARQALVTYRSTENNVMEVGQK
jgi:hypothetical protein